MQKLTEASSTYQNLQQMSVQDLLTNMNKEDKTVPLSVEKSMPQIEALIKQILERMLDNPKARLFYLGSGTSGRLGIVDASECPPTFGVEQGQIIGIIAGGDKAIRIAQEFAEDDTEQAFKDLSQYDITEDDTVIGITASGSTPYVIGGVKAAKERVKCLTGCIVCNQDTELAKICDCPIEVLVGPEFITGSTRMKAGTAQKLVLNMITTSLMIRLGHVKGNKMIDMQLTNHKLIKRGIRYVVEELAVDEEEAKRLVLKYNGVRKAIEGAKLEKKSA